MGDWEPREAESGHVPSLGAPAQPLLSPPVPVPLPLRAAALAPETSLWGQCWLGEQSPRLMDDLAHFRPGQRLPPCILISQATTEEGGGPFLLLEQVGVGF